MKILSLFFLFISIGTTQSDLRTRIEAHYKSVKSIQSDFKQTKVSVLLKNPVVKHGQFFFQDNQIKWMIKSPQKSTILITKEFSKIKEGNEAPKSMKHFTFIKKFMTGLMNGDFLDSGKFSSTIEEKEGQILLTAIPVDARIKKYIQKFELKFKSKELILEQLTVFEKSGDYMKYEFSNQKMNQKINSEVFQTFH